MADPDEVKGTISNDTTSEETRKFKKIARFCDRHTKGTTQSSVKELEIDEAPITSVLEVTEKNFYEKVINCGKDVLINFYTSVLPSST
jgi:thioredoxin-like negative regulator of GroEL